MTHLSTLTRLALLLCIALTSLTATAQSRLQHLSEDELYELLWEEESCEGEIEIFTALIALDPEDYYPYIRRGDLLAEHRGYEAALPDYQRAAELNDEDSDIFQRLGVAYAITDRHQEAIVALNRALEIDPGHAHIYFNRGVIYAELGYTERSCDDYTMAIKYDPTDASYYGNRASSYLALSDFKRALRDAERAIEMDSDYIWAYQTSGIILMCEERYEEAVAILNQGIELAQNDFQLANFYFSRANAYSSWGREEEAIADFTRNIELEQKLGGDVAAALNNRAYSKMELGRYQEALNDVQQAITFDPESPEAHGTQGLCLMHLERYEDAVASSTRAIELGGTLGELYKERAQIYTAMAADPAYADQAEELLRAAKADNRTARRLGTGSPVEIIIE